MKPSAVYPVFVRHRPAFYGFCSASCGPRPRPLWARRPKSVPSSGKITVVVSSPSDFDQALAPLLALRQRYPNDLWVNERYQDAVQQYGIEGHLRKLTEEYQVLSMQHPDETCTATCTPALMGRNTSAAIQQMTEIVADHPDFAPATVHWRKSTLLGLP